MFDVLERSRKKRGTFSGLLGFGLSIQNTLGRAVDFLVPPVCLSCDRSISEQGLLCADCWNRMRFIDRPYCETLGLPFSYDLGKGALSAEAIANPPVFDRARAVVLYDDVAANLVKALKFADRTDLAPWLATWMVRAADDFLGDSNIKPLIIPVPLHRRRLFSRRFNQSAELARHFARLATLEYRPESLRRVRSTRQQVGLARKERQRNVQGAFQVPNSRKPYLKGSHVILVDDVFTTGATLEACTHALRRGGAKRIDCLTFARVAPGDM